ncbi:MAG: tetratricopeptide repeat protein [Hespellia sp.]|nr:tetratricopeptide repeat protein [Hespellia sp.]
MRKVLVILAVLMLCVLSGCEKTDYMQDGTASLEAGRYEEAVETFEKAVEEEENIGEAYRGIGIARYELEQYEEALKSFEEALKYEIEKTPTIYNLMGVCDMRLESYQSALNNFQVGITTAENAEEDYSEIIREMKYNEVICYEKLLDWNNAKTKIEEYIAAYPDDSEAAREAQFLRTR